MAGPSAAPGGLAPPVVPSAFREVAGWRRRGAVLLRPRCRAPQPLAPGLECQCAVVATSCTGQVVPRGRTSAAVDAYGRALPPHAAFLGVTRRAGSTTSGEGEIRGSPAALDAHGGGTRRVHAACHDPFPVSAHAFSALPRMPAWAGAAAGGEGRVRTPSAAEDAATGVLGGERSTGASPMRAASGGLHLRVARTTGVPVPPRAPQTRHGGG